jgi:hypothetical protein
MPTPSRDAVAVLFVHAVAAACAVAAGWLVTTKGSAESPTKDEFAVLADYVESPSRIGWLFAHHNEHRYPLGRAVWAGVLEATDFNFRAGMYVNVGLHTAAAALLVWAARGRRGRASVADAVIPVLLLHWGHTHNLLYGYQLVFAVCVYGLAGWVWAAGRVARGGGTGWLLAACGYATAVVLSGGFGLVFTPLFVAWLAHTVWKRPRSAQLVAAAFAVAWVGYGAWVWLTAPPGVTALPDRSPGKFLLHTVQFLACGVGDPAVPYPHEWPAAIVWVAAAGLYATSLVALVRRPHGTVFESALALAVVGVILLGAASAYARGYGLAARLVTPSAAGLCVCWVAAGGRGRVSWPVTVFVLAAAGGVFWANMDSGVREAYYTRLVLDELTEDVKAGMSPEFVEGRYGGATPVLMYHGTARCVRALRNAGIGVFASAGPDVPFVAVPIDGVDLPREFDCGAAEVQAGNPPRLSLPDPTRPVVGVRVRVRTDTAGGWRKLLLVWRDGRTGTEHRAWVYPPWMTAETAVAFPIGGTPTAIRVEAGSDLKLTIEAAEWLTPVAR